MAWDKTKPAGNVAINLGDNAIRDNNDWLENALGEAMSFPGTVSNRGWPKVRRYDLAGRGGLTPVDRMFILRSDRGAMEVYDSASSGWLSYDFAIVGELKLLPFSLATPPDRWLVADGQEVSQTTYADLYAAIGTTFDNNARYSPALPGVNNFRVPDMRGRAPYGVFAAQQQLVDEEFIPFDPNGSELDDGTYSGTYTGTATKEFQVRVSIAGGTDSFKWSNDGGVTWSGDVAMTGGAQLLADGVSITFGATTGHTVNSTWVVTAEYVDDFTTLGATADKTNLRLLPHHLASHRHTSDSVVTDPGHNHRYQVGTTGTVNDYPDFLTVFYRDLLGTTVATVETNTTGITVEANGRDHKADASVINRRNNAQRFVPPKICLNWAIYSGV